MKGQHLIFPQLDEHLIASSFLPDEMTLRSMFSRKASAAPPFLWRYRSSPYYISLVTGMRELLL